ncbi:MAG: hypothetical protein DLM61_27750 [Pseudonocardiales bacterium]|nr:DUF4158 domain-containing protein [Pseudonocardiales bacterium]PZS21574.1 MAG: hypothetical protein DLM61_27750 [Pseudonocardiales bacterium]
MTREPVQEELIDCWTLVGDELELVAGKRGPTKLGFALLLRFYTERGRFPVGRGELPDAAVEYVASSWPSRMQQLQRRRARLTRAYCPGMS